MGRPVFKEKKGFPSIRRVEIILLKKRKGRNHARVASFILRGVGTAFVAEKKGGGKLHVVFFNVYGS